MRLIDADALEDKFGCSDADILAKEEIRDAPTIDAVPIVRCKDCKWFVDNNGGEWYGCKMFQVVRITPEDAPKPDDFCSYGERRDGDTDNGV